ncbi:MAG: hypothetical protein WBL44_04865 [Nitrososphaeraceae archaeon]|jgi:hypothetical protein
MMNKLIYVAIPILLLAAVPNVSATGIRHDSGDDATDEEHGCHIDGYDSGFAGKYDSDRARECVEHDDNYNQLWAYGCEDSLRTEEECGELINNPVEIEDYEALKTENDRTCYDAGQEDGKAGKPYNKDRASGCDEFGGIGDGYRGGYQFGCETHTTQASCELLYMDKKNYCPNHPDIVGCVDFLHNATNKKTENPYSVCTGAGDPRPNFICPQETNPERYCLMYDNPYCKFIGDLCDDEGFVRPEYPYCTAQVK